jgi:hypothetical protein
MWLNDGHCNCYLSSLTVVFCQPLADCFGAVLHEVLEANGFAVKICEGISQGRIKVVGSIGTISDLPCGWLCCRLPLFLHHHTGVRR